LPLWSVFCAVLYRDGKTGFRGLQACSMLKPGDAGLIHSSRRNGPCLFTGMGRILFPYGSGFCRQVSGVFRFAFLFRSC
jgi:hypothetical protein